MIYFINDVRQDGTITLAVCNNPSEVVLELKVIINNKKNKGEIKVVQQVL